MSKEHQWQVSKNQTDTGWAGVRMRCDWCGLELTEYNPKLKRILAPGRTGE